MSDKEIKNKAIAKATIRIQSWYKGCRTRNKKMLEPCNISELNLDIAKLQKNLKEDYLTPGRQEYYKSTATNNLNLEADFMEFITSKCIDGKRIGEGHYPIDIIKNDIGIDVLCVCLNGNITNEKSLMQNFADCGNNLDQLFEQGKYKEAINLYKKSYYRKLLSAKKECKLTKLFYLAFISTNKCIYLSAFKLNLDAILNIRENGISEQKKSIKFINFIDDKYGATILFKSKKRLELRFCRGILNCDTTIEIYNLDDST